MNRIHVVPLATLTRDFRGQPGVRYPRHRAHPLQQLLKKRDPLIVRLIAALRQVQLHRQYVAASRSPDSPIAAVDNCRSSKPAPISSTTVSPTSSASSTCRSRARPRPPLCDRPDSCSVVSTCVSRDVSAGIKSRKQPAPQNRCQRKRNHHPVHVDRIRARNILPRADQPVHNPVRQQQSQQLPRARQNRALHHLFPHQPHPASAQRRPNRRLPASRSRPRHQQIRDVQARDQQQAQRSSQQRVQPRLHLVASQHPPEAANSLHRSPGHPDAPAVSPSVSHSAPRWPARSSRPAATAPPRRSCARRTHRITSGDLS